MAKTEGRADEVSPEFMERYYPKDIPGLPKYAQLREMLLAAIDDGYWPPGERVPNESAIAASTPYSLGTVQKAMRELVESGVVIRLRGTGTFVAQRRGQMNSPLHLRFEDEAGTPLAVYPRIVRSQICRDEGDLSTFLNTESGQLLRIDRLFRVGSVFTVFSSIYLNSSRFPVFVTREKKKLEACNFKDVIRREYNVNVHRINQSLRLQRLPDNVREALHLDKDIQACKLELRAIGMGGRGIYYQEAFIPPNPCKLRLADWTPGA